MAVPVLKLRKDIWAHFPVNVDSMGRGANGADRHCIEWHNMKLRDMAKQQGKTVEQLKATLFPQMFAALSASPAWTVEMPEPGSKCVAVIAMKFAAAAAEAAPTMRKNLTRRNVKPKTPTSPRRNNVRTWRRSRTPTPPPPAKSKTPKTLTPKTPKSRSPTKAVPAMTRRNHGALEGEALLKKARGIINLMSETTVGKLSDEFATLRPRTVGEFEGLMKNVFDQILDAQAFHPLVMHLLHILDAAHAKNPYPGGIKPSEAIVQRALERAAEEPIFAKMEIEAEETGSNSNNFEFAVNKQKRYMRSCMLLTGFLYREGFMEWEQLAPLLKRLRAIVFETDPDELDYRVLDGATQGLLFVLIRGGQRMVVDGGDSAAMFEALKVQIAGLQTQARRGLIKSMAADFIDAVSDNFRIKDGMPWTVGAPKTDIKPRAVRPAPTQAPKTAVGLGADIGELWRRFPLDVKQDGDMYLVKFHRKKLQDRLAKETRIKTLPELEAALTRQIIGLIDNSAHWRRGPAVGDAGVFVSVIKK
jgi:hypothetical protein